MTANIPQTAQGCVTSNKVMFLVLDSPYPKKCFLPIINLSH